MAITCLKQQVLAGLTRARDELQVALRLTVQVARYDPVILPKAIRDEVSVMCDDLDRMLRALQCE